MEWNNRVEIIMNKRNTALILITLIHKKNRSFCTWIILNFMILLRNVIKNTKGKKILSVTFCGSPKNVFFAI